MKPVATLLKRSNHRLEFLQLFPVASQYLTEGITQAHSSFRTANPRMMESELRGPFFDIPDLFVDVFPRSQTNLV